MSVSESVTQAWSDMNKMADKMFKEYGLSLELPPKSFQEMKAEFVEFEPPKRLVVRIPYDSRFTNPVGIFQGGMLCAALEIPLVLFLILRLKDLVLQQIYPLNFLELFLQKTNTF
ncbi:hypothetical protein LEP1GSC088_4512 [Leptospira interrogans str. L1207]|nr:hypothetical protein LEP1GSC088_4512 [Leptospira interrogans str. L1207]